MNNEQHKINYKNIGMILLLGVVAINIGMSQYTTVNIEIPNILPELLPHNEVMAATPGMVVLNSSMANSMNLSSIFNMGIIAVVVVIVSMMIYGLVGMGGMMGGRR